MVTFFLGFGAGGGLITAIGAQNSFVLAQGVKKQYIYIVPLLCSMIDVVLICAGAAGVGTFVSSHPDISYYASVGGALFLFGYGCKSLCSVFSGDVLHTSDAKKQGLGSIVLTTLAISLLNPHVYFDTIVLLGSISGRFEGGLRLLFALGACSASVVWFFMLSLGGTLLQPLFQKPVSWKILDLAICAIMWSIAWTVWP